MYVEFDWPDKSEHTDFCVSYYGSATDYFLRDEAAQFNRDELLASLMASCAEQGLASEHKQIKNYEDQGAPLVKKYTGFTEEGYGYVHITNDEPEAEFTEVINYPKFDRLSLLKPQKGQGYNVTVKPGQKKTIVIRQNDPTGYSLSSVIMQSSFKLGAKQMEKLCKSGAGQKTT